MNTWRVLAGALFAGALGGGEARGEGLVAREARVGQQTYTYQVHVPRASEVTSAAATANEKPPVIIFLHGIRERGAGGFVPTKGAAGAVVRQQLARVPAIVLLPQCAPGLYWTNEQMEQMTMLALRQTLAEFGGDERRVYLTGVSMGGYGVWHLASQHPGKFAALVAICGGSPLNGGERFRPIAECIGRDTPAWVFHGAVDAVVPVEESRNMVAALRGAGNQHVRYHEYPDVGHNVWLKALGESELMPWLFAQKLK